MKNLVLIRHATAMNRVEFQLKFALADEWRPLTRRGLKKFDDTLRQLKKMNLARTELFFSPFLRTRQTAEVIYRDLAIRIFPAPQLAHGKSVRLWPALIKKSQQKTVILVGHEPELSDFISSVLKCDQAPFKKGELRTYTVEF